MSPPSESRHDGLWSRRLSGVRARIAADRLDALVVSTGNNLRYLTGFVGSAGLLVVGREAAWLLVDGRYEAVARTRQADGALAAEVTVERVPGRYDTALADRLRALGAVRIGLEAEQVTVATAGRWREALPGITFEPTVGVVEAQRLVKDPIEVALFRDAALRLSGVAERLGALVARGRTERQIAAAIDEAMREAGFEQPAFDTIVAAGPNSAYPHARPTDRALEAGDLVVLDFGGKLDGYCVDLTRAACVAPVGEAARALYDAVRASQEAAIAAVRPDGRTGEVDRAARDGLAARGYGDAFVHSTGHGLGLDIHEAPHVSSVEPAAQERIEAGMIFTIEPGAYLTGLGGVRLEDDVLVTTDGCEVLTSAPRDLIVV